MLHQRCSRGHPHLVHIGVKLGDKTAAFGRNFVDKAVVADAAPPVHFVLPEGAAELKTEPTVLASTETGSGRKFLRAFCCPRTRRLHRRVTITSRR